MKSNYRLLQLKENLTKKVFICFLLFAIVQNVTAEDWIAKHAMSPAGYQEEYNKMKSKGLRLASITGYTKNGEELYAAIWNKKAGPDLLSHHGMPCEIYQKKVEEYRKLGYKVKSVSGYSVNGSAKFAVIWEKNARAPWEEKHDMIGDEYQAAVNSFDKQGYRINFVNGYVVNGKEMFAAVWEKTTGNEQIARHNLTAAKYQDAFNEYTAKGYDLKVISGYEKGGVDLFAAIFEKATGPHWAARHGISRFNYQHVADNMYYQGFEPVYIDAYAANGTDNYNVIWENTNMKAADLAKLDAAVKNYMTDQDIKGMSVAVTKNGRLVYAKGFGYADPETKEELCPTHSLRVMSISKSITSAGIMKLVEQKGLKLDRKVFGPGSILGDTYKTPEDQKWLNDITVRSLLHHTSGMRSGNGEAPFNDAKATHDDVAKHLLGLKNLKDSTPHTKYEYSNLGFFWLMMVIEKVSGQTYENYVRNAVLTPSGIGQSMYVGLASGGLKPGEVHYTPHNSWNMNNFAGFGGWVARPMDLLQFLGRFDGQASPADLITKATYDTMMTTTPLNKSRAMGWVIDSKGNQSHRGALGASYSTYAEIGDGLSIAVVINTPYKDDKSLNQMHNSFSDAVKAVSAFPSYNLY